MISQLLDYASFSIDILGSISARCHAEIEQACSIQTKISHQLNSVDTIWRICETAGSECVELFSPLLYRLSYQTKT
jgi:hypothetical protein